MLPNRIQLNARIEEQLKRLKMTTGVTPNISARIAFFNSIESGFRYIDSGYSVDGKMIMDKSTWLGDTLVATELILKMYYPQLSSKEMAQAWASHVEDGISSLRSQKSLLDFCKRL